MYWPLNQDNDQVITLGYQKILKQLILRVFIFVTLNIDIQSVH